MSAYRAGAAGCQRLAAVRRAVRRTGRARRGEQLAVQDGGAVRQIGGHILEAALLRFLGSRLTRPCVRSWPNFACRSSMTLSSGQRAHFVSFIENHVMRYAWPFCCAVPQFLPLFWLRLILLSGIYLAGPPTVDLNLPKPIAYPDKELGFAVASAYLTGRA